MCDRVGILRLGRLVHLQSLDELRKTQVIWARLTNAPAALPEVTGARPATPLGREIAFEVTGPPGPLFAWLGTQPVEEVRVSPTGLNPIYLKYHGTNA